MSTNNDVLFQRGNEDGDSNAWDDTALIKAYDNAVSAMKAKLAVSHPEYAASNGSASKKKKKSKQKTKKKRSSVSKSSHGWKVGDFCQAVFTEDGEIYSARILSTNNDGSCVVKYVGYGNEEEQMLENLMPAASEQSSQDNKTDTASEIESVYEMQDDNNSKGRKSHKGTYVGGKSSRSHPPPWNWNNFTVPPPPPPSTGHNFPGFSHAPNFPTPNYGASQFPPMFPGIPPPPPVFNNPGTDDENEALYSMLISWYMSGYHTGYYQGLKTAKTSYFGGPHR